ncbi:MAG: M23/M56 family metallopeptidase [bacterium]|nr:M23/M56 family metallopeptidase [bacterium]
MERCLEVILRMSLTASFVIAAVCLVRMLLRYAPRRYSYVLWLVVLVRLVCPTAPAMHFGAVPDMARVIEDWQASGEQVSEEQASKAQASGEQVSGTEPSEGNLWTPDNEGQNAAWLSVEQEVIVVPDVAVGVAAGAQQAWEHGKESAHTASAGETADTARRAWPVSDAACKIVCLCWLCGAFLFLGYGITGYFRLMFRLRKKEKSVFLMKKDADGEMADAAEKMLRRPVRIVEDAGIGAPFTVGIFRPVICIPKGLFPFQREMVIAHESMHIQRRDNLWKLTAYVVRCMHWFNPLVWLAFYCFEEDMETSCDEAVLRKLGYERRKEYAETLLKLAECRRGTDAFYSVTFGGKNTKMRIRNALSAKKTRWWVALAATAVVIAAVMLLSVNHKPVQEEALSSDEQTQQADSQSAGSLLIAQDVLQEGMEQRLAYLRQQERLDALNAEIQLAEIMTELSVRIGNEALTEGESRVEESEGYPGFSEQAVPVIRLDGMCALLCNPQTDLEGSGTAAAYSFPLDGVDDGSVIVSGAYGSRLHSATGEATFHSGLDLNAEKGAPVRAAAEGCVYRTGFDEKCGNYVILIHVNGDLTYYAHCDTVDVQAGDIVERGQQIATVGNTGKSTGAHLHFAMSRQGAFMAPRFAEMSITDSSMDSGSSVIVLPVEVRVES